MSFVGIHRSSISIEYYKILIVLFILLYGCRSTNNTTKASKNQDFASIENSKSKDSASYRIISSPNDYPIVHIPFAADSNAKVWKDIDLSPQPPVYPLSAKEEEKRFVLKPGYDMKPVLTDPKIMHPAAVKFDGNGRMYVLELRSYMRDVDANGETSPTSRISRWEDTDNDGVYDQGSVFVDSLVFPRFVMPFGPNTILSLESNEDNVYKYTDTNGDGAADKKELFATGMGRVGNLEIQTSFLTWAMDNWMYSTQNSVRIRWTRQGVIKEPTGNPGSQWGVTQDDYGKTWYQGGASGVPDYFQFPIKYGHFDVNNELEEGFRVPYSLIDLADYQPGMGQVKPDGSLAHVTGAAGNTIFRGDRLPEEIQGSYFYGEPVARIVRRIKITEKEGLTYLSNYYQPERSEFIQSRDPLFRPLDMETAPDGTMYIADMYHGIIQEGTFTQPGTYIRAKIKQYQLDNVHDHGRIWRLTYKGMGRDTQLPKMFEETSLELVEHFKNPNGWWRDKAQQLLVLRQDRSVVPALRKMVNTSDDQLARFHALWTLEGLGSLKTGMIRKLMKDANSQMRIQAIRASETLYKNGVTSLVDDYQKLTRDPNTEVDIQAMMTLNILEAPDINVIIDSAQAANSAHGVQVVGDQILEQSEKQKELAAKNFTAEQLKLYNRGATIYSSECATCHGNNGMGAPVDKPGGATIAPALSGSKHVEGHREFIVKILLHGLKGSIEGENYTGQIMTSRAANDDEWLASVSSYVRNSMGNKAPFVNPEYVAMVRKGTTEQKTHYIYRELVASVPQELKLQNNWKVTASSSASASPGLGSTADPSAAFTLAGWKTTTAQKAGMWFKVNFKKPVKLTEIQYDSPSNMFPKKYIVQVSMDGAAWNTIAKGQGKDDHTIINFNTTRAQYVRIKETAKGNYPWGMRMLKLYARK